MGAQTQLELLDRRSQLRLELAGQTIILGSKRTPLVIDEVKRGIQGPAGVSVIVDNLTSTLTDASLSANQGRVLNENKTELTTNDW